MKATDTAPTPARLEEQLCFPLYAASREVIKQYRPYLDEAGITYTQFITLQALYKCGCMSVKELGAMLYLDSGTLTPLLKSMERKGLVTRSRSREDERVLLVQLTAEGETLEAKCHDIPVKIRTLLNVPLDQVNIVSENLYRLLDLITE